MISPFIALLVMSTAEFSTGALQDTPRYPSLTILGRLFDLRDFEVVLLSDEESLLSLDIG